MISYRSNKTTGSPLIGAQWQADLAGMMVIDTAKEATVSEADLM